MHLDFLNMYLHLRNAESRRNHAKYSEKSKTAKHTIKEGNKSEEKRRFIKEGKSEEKRFSSFLITATNMIGGEENFQT